VGAIVVNTQGGGGPSPPKGKVVAADRGDVEVTVGGVGHVNTLTGAARLSVPGSAGSAGTADRGAGGGVSGGAKGAGAGGASGSGAAGASASGAGGSGGGSQVAADAVFPTATGHVQRLLVKVGDPVIAGQPVAQLADDGVSAAATGQARNDLATARLELAQKQVHDPLRGLPPTAAERAADQQAVNAARAKLNRTLGPPLAADVATARNELARAIADLRLAQAGTPSALAAAELTVTTARHKLDTLTGSPDPAEVAAARLDLSRATLDQEVLLRAPAAPSPAAVNAANLAVAAAEQKLSAAIAGGNATDIATARAELAKAESERAALLQPPSGPTDAARFAGQLAVDAARQKLERVLNPAPAVVSGARAELAKAEADLAALRQTRGQAGVGAARAAVDAARLKLARVTGPPLRDLAAAARFDLRKVEADLAVLRQRGAPANAIDIALARLKVDVAQQRVGLADEQARRLTVIAPSTGTVTSVLTTAGAPVDAATPLARVQDLGHLVVTLDLSEFDVGRTRVGSQTHISVDALNGREFNGRVTDVATTGVDTGGVVNFPVVVTLPSTGHVRPGMLRPGMSVSARIVVKRRVDVIRVPAAAVNDQGANPTVLVQQRSGVFTTRTVEVGLTGGEFAEVTSGLQPGERVLVPEGGGGGGP
jgi:RND family efflux transporter MFP subunit